MALSIWLDNFCAIAAVNEETLTLSQTWSFFPRPVKQNEEISFEATVYYPHLPKRIVEVIGKCNDEVVYESKISILVHEEHIFEVSIDYL